MGLFDVRDLPRPEPQALKRAIDALAARFGNRLITSQAVREQHGHTTTWLRNQPPDAVVMAQETTDIQDAVRICGRHGVPVIGWDHGGVGEVLAALQPEGRVVPGDRAALAERARAFIHHPPALPQRIPYTLSAMQQATLDVYDEFSREQ